METARDFEDPSVTQLAVFLQNRVGQLRELLKTLDQAGVSVLALSVADSADFATVRLIVDRQDEARRALTADGYAVAESTALAVVLPPGRSSLLAMCRALILSHVSGRGRGRSGGRPCGRVVHRRRGVAAPRIPPLGRAGPSPLLR
jgi:hypothetical protein